MTSLRQLLALIEVELREHRIQGRHGGLSLLEELLFQLVHVEQIVLVYFAELGTRRFSGAFPAPVGDRREFEILALV